MDVHFNGPLDILAHEKTQWRTSAFSDDDDEGASWDAYDVNVHEDCEEPLLLSDLIFATTYGMTRMIDFLIPLTVRISKQACLQKEVHDALMEINCKVACQWATVAFKKQS